MEYAIETIDLIKKYPISARRERGGHGFAGPRGGATVNSLAAMISLLKGTRGPFIQAMRGVNLRIKTGEIFGVLGPNGAGKTTLIKILCTLVIHDEGEAYVHGFDVRKQPGEVLKNLQAVLPESRGFNWRLTGRQNLEFYALLYGLRSNEAKDRIDYLLDSVGLKERADDGYQKYSTGMQRKLLLCRALLRNVPTLLFDEPTAGLDPTSAAEFRNMLHDRLAHEENKTILLSTHNLHEAQDMCDRVAILDRGNLIACDTPDNVRYMMFKESVLKITFTNALYNHEQEIMVGNLERLPGVHVATPEVSPDTNFCGITVRVDKNMDLSNILEVITKSKLKISTINTEEPTLEDAFIQITAHQDRQPSENDDYQQEL